MPERLPTPGYDADTAWFELIFAYDGQQVDNWISAMNCPSFLIDVPEGQTEIIMNASQVDFRYSKALVNPDNCSRHEQAPLLVRFFECSRETLFQLNDRPMDGEYNAGIVSSAGAVGEIYMVHMSAWAHTRDAMCAVKVLRPGRYVAMVSMPSGYIFEKMIFRVYSSKKVGARVLAAHKNMISVNPGMPLSAIPYSLTGLPRIDEYREHLPRMFDEEEGKGGNYGVPDLPGWQMQVREALDSNYGDDEPREKAIGAFGGPGGGASTNAVERSSASPCAFM